jgi:hypothetical protein
MSHLHGPAANKIRVLENENKMLKEQLGKLSNKPPIKINYGNEKVEDNTYIAFPNRRLNNIWGVSIFNIELFGETVINCSQSIDDVKIYLKYHDKNTNEPINDLSIFQRIVLTYGKYTIASRVCHLNMVTKGDKDYYSLTDIFPGLEFYIKNTVERHLKLQFDVSSQCRFEIDEMYCGYSEGKVIKMINEINCFRDFFTGNTSYEINEEVYYNKVKFIDMRNHEQVKKSDIHYDLYINDKYIICGKDNNDKGLHYYKIEEKYYILYVQQVYQFKTD